MKDDFIKLVPDPGYNATAAERRNRPYWRVTIWNKGKAVVHKDFLFESLADAWAQRTRDQYRALKATGIFVKKDTKNDQTSA